MREDIPPGSTAPEDFGPDGVVRSAATDVGRRQFVRLTGGLIASVVLGAGCGESEATGTVSVSVTGLPSDATDGGTATIIGTTLAGPLIVDAIPGDTVYEDVPVGVYSVTYQPPDGYTLAPNSPATVADLQVTVGVTTPVAFSLLPAVGVIRTIVSGHDSQGANAGSVSILRLDIPGQTTTDDTVPVSGVFQRGVIAGTFRVTYAAPSGHIIAAGVVNPRTVTVDVGETEVVSFAVEQVGSPQTGIIFHSDWSTALGITATAFRDTAKPKPWNYHCCDSNTNSSIVTKASLGLQSWPPNNVYRVGTQASLQNGINTHILEVDLGAPAAGEHRYFRYYLQVTHGDAHGNGTAGNIEHGVETADTGGGDGMNFYRIPRSNGTWFPAWRDITLGWRYVGTSLSLLKNRTYRMEWHLAYGATTYTVEIRITDEVTGQIVATEADFHRYIPSPEDTNIRLGGVAFSYTPAHHRLFRVGTNGPSGNFPVTNLVDQNMFLHGAVAISDTDWVGPYANGI